MKNKLQAIAEHLSTHKTKYGVAAGITVSSYAAYRFVAEWMEFYEEYVAPHMADTE